MNGGPGYKGDHAFDPKDDRDTMGNYFRESIVKSRWPF